MLSSPSSGADRIEALIRSVRRRRTLTLVLEQSALALTLMFCGSILMLLLGTQILDWYWLALLGAIGAGVALLRVRRERLASYRLAQLLDRRFALSDALSTAWFLLARPKGAEQPLAEYQIASAGELARSVRPADAFPFRGQRAWAVAGAVAAAALGLFAVRYLVTSSLSLRQAMIPIRIPAIFERTQEAKSRAARRPLEAMANNGNPTLPSPWATEKAAAQGSSRAGDAKEAASDSAGDATTRSSNDPQASRSAESGAAEKRDGARGQNQGDKPGSAPGKPSATAAAPPPKGSPAGGQEESPGLMDKMKDALSGLMAKMRPSQNAQGTQQKGKGQESDAKRGDRAEDANKGQRDQANAQQNAGNQEAGQDREANGQAQGQTKEKVQGSEGQSSDQSAENGADARSGVGRQDGEKNVRQAKQLEAMGKLEEIIGKRSANLTGEMTVETPSTKQQLTTAYSQRQGHHSDLGGEINRDEIPPMYREYVRNYMVQVRKQDKNGP